MNASKPTIAGVALLTVLLIAFYALKPPPDELPEEKNPPTSTLDNRSTLQAGPESDRRIRSILREPNAGYRRPLLRAYFHTLEAEEFPAAFDSLVRALGRQRSRDYNYLLKVWSQKDPQAAWEFISPLFDAMAPSRWADSWDSDVENWEKNVTSPRNLQLLQGLPVSPDPQLFQSFAGGLSLADTPEAERLELAALYEEQVRETFDSDYEFRKLSAPSAGANRARPYLLSQQIKNADRPELLKLVESARDESLPAAFGIGLRRLVQLDPDQVDTALELAQSYASSGTATEIARAWAELDPTAAWDWFKKNRPDDLMGFAGNGMIAFLPEEQRRELLQQAEQADDTKSDVYEYLIQHWAREDLPAALEAANQFLDDEQFTELLFGLEDYDLDPEGWAPFLETLATIPAQLENGTMAQLTEDMGDWDAAATARFGVGWLLTSDLERDAVLKVWRGESDPSDGLMSDRTFGCLRCWALTNPQEMQRWIDAQEEPDVRASLQWLFENAAGN